MSEDEKRSVTFSGSITDVLGAGKGVQILVDAIERGIGKALGPWQRRRDNRAEIENVEEWATALNKYGLQITSGDLNLTERTVARMAFDAIRHQEAREAVAVEAVEDFKRIADSKEQLDPTQPASEWIDRFWRLAGDVSSDDMRSIWGRVLARQIAGEVKFAARTLDFLSTLSGAEAGLIANLAKCVCQYEPARTPTEPGSPLTACLIRGMSGVSIKVPDAIARRLVEHTGSISTPHFGAIGIYYESGWAHDAYARIHDDAVRMTIGGKPFILRSMHSFGSQVLPLEGGKTPGACNIGGGEELTRLGREILSLIDSEPDPAYVQALAAVYDVYGWVLRPMKD